MTVHRSADQENTALSCLPAKPSTDIMANRGHSGNVVGPPEFRAKLLQCYERPDRGRLAVEEKIL